MKNLARGSVLLSVLVLAVGLIYVQLSSENAFAQANSQDKATKVTSQANVENKEVTTETTAVSETASADKVAEKKLVRKTAIVNKGSNARSFSATAYCLRGKTASGSYVRRGIVAADPRVLPLGTRIYINAGAYSGNYTVTDTGGVIKGRILDIWVPSCSEAIRFGRRNISVSVIGR